MNFMMRHFGIFSGFAGCCCRQLVFWKGFVRFRNGPAAFWLCRSWDSWPAAVADHRAVQSGWCTNRTIGKAVFGQVAVTTLLPVVYFFSS